MRRSSEKQSYDHAPALRRLSQNFLVDATVARRLVDALVPSAADHVLEVGPGRAALTALLLPRAARVVAVELDRRLTAALRADFPLLEIYEADILEVPLATLRRGPRLRILTSLPYAISSPFLCKLIAELDDWSDAVILFQAEFAERLAAAAGTREFGSLSVLAQLWLSVTLEFPVPPNAFRPRPQVWSRAVRLAPRIGPPPPELRPRIDRVLRAGFSGRRKRIETAFHLGLACDRDTARRSLLACDVDPDARAGTIPPDRWLALASSDLGAPR